MIVPKMTFEEIRNEFFHDHVILAKGMAVRGAMLSREMLKTNQRNSIVADRSCSASRNNWLSFYNLDKNNQKVLHTCLYFDELGLKVLYSTFVNQGELYIVRLNSHFFNRYDERLALKLIKPEKIVKHYFKANLIRHETHWTNNRLSDARIFFPVQNGVALGYQNDELRWIEIKTFISDQMLKGAQVDTAEYLRNYTGEGMDEDQPDAKL